MATGRTDQRLAQVPVRAASASSSVFAPFVRQGTQGDDLRRQILQVERFREETGVATLPIIRKVLGGRPCADHDGRTGVAPYQIEPDIRVTVRGHEGATEHKAGHMGVDRSSARASCCDCAHSTP